MILSDKQFLEQMQAGRIEIDPFNENNLGSNSYDVTLASTLLVFDGHIFDPYKDQSHKWTKIDVEEKGVVLRPDCCYLASTNERTFSPFHVPCITGKSSIGRNFIEIHQTAGFGDVGFNGFWTLEISVKIPTVVYPNMKIGQVYFYDVGECLNDYSNKSDASYTSQKLEPIPQPSQLWKKIK